MTLNLKMFPICSNSDGDPTSYQLARDTSMSMVVITRLELTPLGCKLRDVGQYLKDRQHSTYTSSIILIVATWFVNTEGMFANKYFHNQIQI